MSLSNSGIKEMSSSNMGKSYAGAKDGSSFPQGGDRLELNPPVVSFSDIKEETQKICFELAEQAFSNNHLIYLISKTDNLTI
jgi:hypothetical protein